MTASLENTTVTHHAKDVYWGIVFPLLSGIAIVGNAVNIFVFSSGRLSPSPFHTLLLGLAVTEFLQGSFFLTEKMAATYSAIDYSSDIFLVLTKLGDLSFYSANWVTVSISVFRCIAVSCPLNARRSLTRGRARRAIFASVLFSAIKEIPYWIRDFVITFDESLKILEPINQVFGRIIPCLIVLTSTLISAYHMRVARQGTELLTQTGSRDEAGVIRMLLFMLIIFFLTNTYCVVILLCRIYEVPGIEPLLFSTPIAFGFNSAMNVFLYFLMNPAYRKTVCCCGDRWRHLSAETRNGIDGSVSLQFVLSNRPSGQSLSSHLGGREKSFCEDVTNL